MLPDVARRQCFVFSVRCCMAAGNLVLHPRSDHTVQRQTPGYGEDPTSAPAPMSGQVRTPGRSRGVAGHGGVTAPPSRVRSGRSDRSAGLVTYRGRPRALCVVVPAVGLSAISAVCQAVCQAVCEAVVLSATSANHRCGLESRELFVVVSVAALTGSLRRSYFQSWRNRIEGVLKSTLFV